MEENPCPDMETSSLIERKYVEETEQEMEEAAMLTVRVAVDEVEPHNLHIPCSQVCGVVAIATEVRLAYMQRLDVSLHCRA